MNESATILIAARNAGETIERAISSALRQGDYPILLVDDFSTDDTVARAGKLAGNRLRVARPPAHQTLGLARQVGLMAVETPCAVWLDADDELLPGRVDRMLAGLEADASDLVSDAVEIVYESRDHLPAVLPIPGFFRNTQPLARLFERNYLPGIGVLGFRCPFARRIGYDVSLHGAEDVDFALRAVAAGARFSLLRSAGYRIHAHAGSLSRRIENQRRMYRLALLKHKYEEVRNLYRRAGHDDRITAWGLVSMAMFREEYQASLSFLSEAESRAEIPGEILEPEGPCPKSERWRVCFFRGTALLLMDQPAQAAQWLEMAEQECPSAEAANNLGVARNRLGDPASARELFAQCLVRFPVYLGAAVNLESQSPDRITSHPLRGTLNRSDYSAGGLVQVFIKREPRPT